jgi:hypothetical protein
VNRAAPSAETVPASGPLDRLRAGEIDVHGYVEAKVQEATAQLGVLPLDQLESIRAALRQRMASDPTLADLLRTVAGGAGAALPVPPSPPSDD